MHGCYLEVTFRNGKPLAAYYYLPRQTGDKSVRVEKRGPGLIVDLAADGRAIGIEIAIPSLATAEAINEILRSYGFSPIDSVELRPLQQAA